MMNRRALVAGVAAATASWRGRAYAASRLPVVGFVGFASPSGDRATLAAFRAGLVAHGLQEGRDVTFEAHSVSGDVEKGHALIAALAARPIAVFLSPGPAATRAIVNRTRIPVVAIGLPPEPAREGLYASLAKPGGSVTGFSTFGEDLSAKRIEVLREMLPGARTIGVLHNTIDPTFSQWGEQTIGDITRQGLKPVRLPLSSAAPAEAARLVTELREAGGQALVVVRDFLTSSLIPEIGRRATEAGIAVVGEHREFATAGALFSYGPDIADLFRRAAGYIERILKGEPASTLPIQLPTKFELVVNTQVARKLGLTVPMTALVRADEILD